MTINQANLCPLLAVHGQVDLRNPLLWAVALGWILTVVLHELAHGLVAHFGGDYTVRQRGGLSLNPFRYIDPVNSILLPAFFLLSGGLPLVGGVTFIRNDLLYNRAWATAVSLAGPATNFLLFVLLLLPFHPAFGWVNSTTRVVDLSAFQLCLATLGFLQFIACVFNLIPLPPLDGFNAIKPFFDAPTQQMLNSPGVRFAGLAILFFVVFKADIVITTIYRLEDNTLFLLGFGDVTDLIGQAFNKVIFSE